MVSTRFQNVAITITLGLFVFGGSVAVGAPTRESAVARREPRAGNGTPSVQLVDVVDDNDDGVILPRIVANDQGTLESMEAMRFRKKKSSKKKFDPLESFGELKNAGGVAAELIPSLFIRDESEIADYSRKQKQCKLDPVAGLTGGVPVVGGAIDKANRLLKGLPLVGGLLASLSHR